jgi:hypothetical protein
MSVRDMVRIGLPNLPCTGADPFIQISSKPKAGSRSSRASMLFSDFFPLSKKDEITMI